MGDLAGDLPPHLDPRFVAAVAAMAALLQNHDIKAVKQFYANKHGGDAAKGAADYFGSMAADAAAHADALLVRLATTSMRSTP